MKESTAKACPRCRSVMEPVEVGLVTLDRCGGCQGLWFDGGEFDRTVRIVTGMYTETLAQRVLLEAGADPVEAGEHIDCPVCAGRMATYRLRDAGLEIDACGRCRGMWFDGGEFETFQASLDARRPRLSERDLEEIRRRPVGSLGATALAGAVEDMVVDTTDLRTECSWTLLDLLQDMFIRR